MALLKFKKTPKDTITKELMHDSLMLQMVKNDTQIIKTGIQLLFENTQETQLCKLYTMCRYTIYLISTFCKPSDNIVDIRNRLVIANYLALSDKNKVKEGTSLAYTNDFLKEYLKCTNTILHIADKLSTEQTLDEKLYNACKNKLDKLREITYKAILGDRNQFLDQDLWIETIEKIEPQVNREIMYCDKITKSPSIRMRANQGISKSEFKGIQALLAYNQTFQLAELV